MTIIRTPHEGSHHTCTWMSYGASMQVYETKFLLRSVQANLRTIAISIVLGSISSSQQSSNSNNSSSKETVNVLVRQNEYSRAQEAFQKDIAKINREKNVNITLHDDIVLIPIPNLNDIWIRDSGPTFVHISNKNDTVSGGNDSTISNVPLRLGGVDTNFNGWGMKQEHDYDKKVAKFIIDYINKHNHIHLVHNARSIDFCTYINDPSICFEGGGIEFDGYGTAIIIESCFLNANRNPNMTKEQCTTILCNLFGLSKIIWLPGLNDTYDITDGHVDGYIRIVNPTLLVMAYDVKNKRNNVNNTVQEQHISILQNATNARDEKYRIVFIPNAKIGTFTYYRNPDYCPSYVNYYLCNNNTVLIPQFRIDRNADRMALHIFQTELFPNHTIIPIDIHDGIAKCGGGIHCTTQQQPSTIGL